MVVEKLSVFNLRCNERFMVNATDRNRVIAELRSLLHSLFSTKAQGALQARLSKDQGYADGYMEGLLRAGIVTQRELLSIISEERGRVAGPATRLMRLDEIPRGSA
jgi:hypothetical protein